MSDSVSETELIRLLLVDDHTIIRSGLANMLNTCEEFEVVGEASSGSDAIQLHGELNPDVTILDVVMPNMSGIHCLQRLKERCPNTNVLMLSSSELKHDISRAVQFGADGYITKASQPAELIIAILQVAAGDSYFCPTVSKRLKGNSAASKLTPRESEVLDLLREGMSNPEIGAELGITPRTAKAHVAAILMKLSAKDRAQAVAKGFELGLLR